MAKLPELVENDLIKGSKNKEQDTNSIKESKDYAEFDSFKQGEYLVKQEQNVAEEEKEENLIIRIFMGIYRAITGQNKKPNKLDIEEIIQDEINENMENKVNNKEQEQTSKQEKDEINDFDVFATKKNKEEELKNRIEEIQPEPKVNKPVMESISDEEKPESKVNKPVIESVSDEKKPEQKVNKPVMESISDEEKPEQKVNKQPVMESIDDEKKQPVMESIDDEKKQPVMESISDEKKPEQKVNKQPVMESIDDEKSQIQLEEKNNSKSKMEQKVIKSVQNHLPDDVKPTVDAINDEEEKIEKKAEEKSDNINKKSFFKKIFSFKFGKKNKKLDVEEVSDDLEEQKSSKESISDEEKPEPKVNKQPIMESIDDEAKKTSTTVKEAISDDATKVVQQSENKDNKISTFDDKTYYTNMYNGNVIKYKKEQDVFIEKLDKINQQSQENKVKSVVNSKFLEEFNAYVTNDLWIIDNTERVMEYNDTLYNSKFDNTKKNPEENFKFLEMCYQNLDLLDKKGLTMLSYATENALQLTRKYGLEKVDEEKFKHFVSSIPEMPSLKKVFISALRDIRPDVQEHIKDDDFKKTFKERMESRYGILDHIESLKDDEKYVKFRSDDFYINNVKQRKHDEIVRNTINNESLDKSWMFDFDHSKADVDKLLSNSDNINNFINHLQHKKEVFSQPDFEHTYEDYYSVIRPETCVVSAILTHMDSIDGSSVDKEKARKVCMDFLEDKHIRKKELLKLYAETDDKEIQTVISNKMNKYIEQDRKNSVDDESILDDIMNSGKIIINALNKEGPLAQQIQDLIQKVDINEFAELDTYLDNFQNTNLYKTDAKFKTFIDKTISKQHELYPDEEEDTKSNDVVMQSSKLPEDIQESSKSNNSLPEDVVISSKTNNSLPEDIENPIEIDDDLPSEHIKGNVLDGKAMQAISVAQTGEQVNESGSKGIQSAQKQKNNGMTI